MADPRGTTDLVGHKIFPATSNPPGGTQNWIARASTARGAWVEKSCMMIGDWRARFRSAYIHWAIAINGLHVAAARYEHVEFTGNRFGVRSIRINNPLAEIQRWEGPEAAKAHLATVPKMVAGGIIDMYSIFEECIFAFYRVRLTAFPEKFIAGTEWKSLRKLRGAAASGDAVHVKAWDAAWTIRLNDWQRNRIYDRLDKVFLAYFNEAGLKQPSNYEKTTPTTWAETIRLIAVLRNAIVHGATVVPEELADLAAKPHGLGMSWVEGEPLEVTLEHLQAVEAFADQLLTALNLSLLEHEDAYK